MWQAPASSSRPLTADRPCAPRSLFQKPRSPAENDLFYKGLSQLHVWYGHAETVCWQQTELPPGFAEKMAEIGLARTYEESGWCACTSQSRSHVCEAHSVSYAASGASSRLPCRRG